MGVRGLSTFVKKHQDEFLSRHELCNEVVVIDGDNLIYRLSSTCKGLNSAFGGDYKKYSSKVEEFFRNLMKCEITPIVLLDGGSDPSNRKLKTAFKRLNEKLERTTKLTPSSQGRHTCLPHLSKTTFLEVLRRLRVSHAVCDFEADEPLAALAAHLGCAVVSDDTDFFAFGVPCVPLGSLAAAPERTDDGRWYTECVLFRHDRFMAHYGLKPRLMPLFACLLGNDYISPAALQKFFLHVMTQLKKEERPTVLALVRRSMANYVLPSTDLLQWLELPPHVLARARGCERPVEDQSQEPACACVEPLFRWMVGCVHGARDVPVHQYRRQGAGRSCVLAQAANVNALLRTPLPRPRRPDPQLVGNKFAALLLDEDDASSDDS
ncbi:protein asteroid homolog 1-like [Pollicipes pollicipes]|uniref:protein asteroid homolog 1-like n=1 Tax=Pollicipes pollicipes TaxID=41117 RepID=UPI001885388B|nr:protein asteroid homolog 1-like [Pollicipes pollicipes]